MSKFFIFKPFKYTMQISSNYNLLNKKILNRPQKTPKKADSSNCSGTINSGIISNLVSSYEQYRIETKRKKSQAAFNAFLNKPGKIDKEEYNTILKKNPDIIRCSKIYIDNFGFTRSKPEEISKIALSFKKYFDINFKNYRIISIGTSPAIISEALESLGVEVLYLPMTHLKIKAKFNAYTKFLDVSKDAENDIKLLMEYLEKQGLKNDDKQNILFDYSYRGDTLSLTKEIIKEYLNIPNEKISKCDIIRTMKNKRFTIDGKSDNEKQDCINTLLEDMFKNRMYKISNVPHVNLGNHKSEKNAITIKSNKKEETFKLFDNFSQKEARAFSLCVFEELYKSSNFKT